MMMMMIMMMTLLIAKDSQVVMAGQVAYLSSYQVEDSCQFSLCGPEYSAEFMLDQAPKVGSCSGDCNLLAINLNTDKFSKQFLWSQCANMCQQKYSFNEYREYKPRFLCMERCYTSYQVMVPHHNLARYCIKASCPNNQDIHQVDCFTTCSEHVSTKVSKADWQNWAKALAGSCQVQKEEEVHNSSFDHKLICADRQVWAHMTTTLGISQSDVMATHCYSTMCHENLKCAKSCLSHLQSVTNSNRQVWLSCSKSVQCVHRENLEGQVECADKCLVEFRERQEKMEEERRRKEEHRQKQALLSVQSRVESLMSCWRTMTVMITMMMSYNLIIL